MAIVWIDGFDQYASASGLANSGYEYYTTSGMSRGTPGRFGKGAYISMTTSGAAFQKTYGSGTSVSFGIAVLFINFTTSTTFVSLLDGVGNSNIRLSILNDGSIRTDVRTVGTNYTPVGQTIPGIFKAEEWTYLEAEITHAATGVVKLYADGNLVFSQSGISVPYQGGVSSVRISRGGGYTQYVDDFYITDTTTRLGDCTIDIIPPSADTAQKDFVASIGSDNYAMVNQIPNTTNTYVSVNAANKKDLYTVGPLTGTPSGIIAVANVSVATKTASGYRTMQNELVSGGVEESGVETSLGTTVAAITTIHEKDPATSAAWTQSGVEALKIGMSTVA